MSEWSRGRLVLLPDSAAALFALRANPGIPESGIVAVCDFGGSGTTLSLVDAADGYQAIAPAVRYTEFSGDRLDQALLTHVVSDLSTAGSFDTSATSAIGSLKQLRAACRYAKEQLSSANVTTLAAELPGYQGEIRLTRNDLEDAIRQQLDSFVGLFHEVLQRNGIRLGDLAAVASVGGGASIPLVTRTLSEQSGALVISAPRPHLTAAVGAALRAARGPGEDATALAPTALGSVSDATIMSEMPIEPAVAPALAWSEADDDSGIMPIRAGEYDEVPPSEPAWSRPETGVVAAEPEVFGATDDPWYRRPLLVAVATALALIAIGAGVLITLRHTSGSAPSTPSPSVGTTPASSAPASSDNPTSQQPSSQEPTSQQTTTNPPSSTTPDTSSAAPTTSDTPTTTTTTPAQTTTTQPPTTASSSQSPGWPRFPRGPGDRPFPQPGQGGR